MNTNRYFEDRRKSGNEIKIVEFNIVSADTPFQYKLIELPLKFINHIYGVTEHIITDTWDSSTTYSRTFSGLVGQRSITSDYNIIDSISLVVGDNHNVTAVIQPINKGVINLTISYFVVNTIYSEQYGVVTPQVNKFIVNYDNGIITFAANLSGMLVAIEYMGRGSILISSDINDWINITSEVITARGLFSTLNDRLDYLTNRSTVLSRTTYDEFVNTAQQDQIGVVVMPDGQINIVWWDGSQVKVVA